MASILVVDDNTSSAKYMQLVLTGEGHEVRTAENGLEGLLALEARLADLVITDLQMPELDGMELLARVGQRWPDLPVIAVSVQEEVETVVAAVRQGALNYLLKPATPENILQAVDKALVQRPAATEAATGAALSTIRGKSRAMVEVRHLVALAARTDVNILITGQTGTGKEVVSRAIHSASKLAERPFVAHNCAATPPELFESHFFGHKKGSFTGATQDRTGLLEAADGGVFFLDELSSMPIEHQAKLLRVIDDGEVVRVGDSVSRRVSVRFFAAVNRPPEAMIRSGELREDLYYRLRGVEFTLPPLNERREDIPELAAGFLDEGHPGFTNAALTALAAHDWRGNVRELKNVVQSARSFAGDERVDVPHLELSWPGGPGTTRSAAESATPVPPTLRTLRAIEEDAIRQALAACDGNQSLAARALGIDRSTLRRKLGAMNERGESD